MTPTEFVLPVGHYLGRYHPQRHAPPRYHKVRLGSDLLRLSDDAFTVWALSHGVPHRSAVEPWTRLAVLEAAGQLADPERQFNALVRDGLVAEGASGTPDAIRFARNYRIRPLMTGLGNTAREPTRFGIGVIGRPAAVTVDLLGFELWQWGRLDQNLWQTAHRLRSVQSPDSPGSIDPEQMLTEVLRRLPVLLGHNAVYLDRAQKPHHDPPKGTRPTDE